MSRWRLGLSLLALLLATSSEVVAASPDDWQACARAGAAAERRYGIPEGLLNAIGLVESGRVGPQGAAPWPWTIDVAGAPGFFDTSEEAVRAVQDSLASGTASIDVGCFQVNLRHHPDAFASLPAAFEPAGNADYAARFLLALRGREGTWEAAVAAYHSATPELGLPYRDRVFARWAARGQTGATQPVVAFGVRVLVPSPPGSAPRVIAMPPVAAGSQAAALPVMRPATRVNGRS